MNNEQSSQLIELVETNNKLLEQGLDLTKRLITLFEKYDADVFKEEEIKRDIQNHSHQRPSRRAGSAG